MRARYLGTAAVVALLDTVLLLIVGAAMWRDAPSPADEAVGKGLVTLGVALALPTILVALAFLESGEDEPEEEPTRSDWDAV